jgi:steroid 5-alpha reductase family enzyme
MLRGTFFPRQVVVTTLMLLWGLRLSLYLYTRNLETSVSTDAVAARTLWAVTCATPAVLINALQHDRKQFDITEMFGVSVASVALLMETLADLQKLTWHARHAEGRPGKESTQPPVCATGIWALSRHPNLFSEIAFHFGVYIVAAPVLPPWVCVFPALLTFQIIFLRGGLVYQEQLHNYAYSFYPSYLAYRDAVSPLWPMPQSLWAAVPQNLKRTLFLEVDRYKEYDRELVSEMDALKKGKMPLSTVNEVGASEPIEGIIMASEA